MTARSPNAPVAETWEGKGGQLLTLRPIAPADVGIADAFLRNLSFGTRYFRFGRGDFLYSEDELRSICNPDPSRRSHLIVVAQENRAEVMVGSARYEVLDGGPDCEFAIVVMDGWQGHGVGRRLMRALLAHAAHRGLKSMFARVLGTNARMIDFLLRLGFEIDERTSRSSVKVAVKALAA